MGLNPVLYSEQLLDHFRHPRNAGTLDAPATVVDVENPACGDMLRLSAEVRDGVLARVRFQVKGCTAAIAAGSALAVWLEGKSLAEVRGIDAKALGALIEKELGGLPAASKHVAVLAADGVAALLKRVAA